MIAKEVQLRSDLEILKKCSSANKTSNFTDTLWNLQRKTSTYNAWGREQDRPRWA